MKKIVEKIGIPTLAVTAMLIVVLVRKAKKRKKNKAASVEQTDCHADK